MLQLKKVTKIFSSDGINRKKVLDDLNLVVKPGEFVTVIGSNGAGKSTMLNAIAGLYPVESGHIFLGEDELTGLPGHERAKFIGRVYQDPLIGTASTMTIEENLSIASKRGCKRGLQKAVSGIKRAKMKEELSCFGLGLEDRLNVPVGFLSGGQRQALTLLMAVFAQPSLLLLDEHTAALDPKTGKKVLELTEKLVRTLKLTTLMVTHNIAHSLSMGDRTVMMHEGRIIWDAEGDERKAMTPRDVLRLFEEKGDESTITDRMLLARTF